MVIQNFSSSLPWTVDPFTLTLYGLWIECRKLLLATAPKSEANEPDKADDTYAPSGMD
jgi:hypothetical protein